MLPKVGPNARFGTSLRGLSVVSSSLLRQVSDMLSVIGQLLR